MITSQFADIRSLWIQTVDKFIAGDARVIDKAWSPRLFSFNNMLRARSSEMDFDFSWVGLTRPRWARFLHAYVDRDDLLEFLDKVRILRRGAEVGLYTRRDTDHDWGSCLMGISFMASPDPHVSVFSRTSSFAQTGIVDLAFAHVIAREAGRIAGIPVRKISMNWYCSSLFISTLHLIPYLTSSGKLEEVLAMDPSTNKFVEYTVKIYNRYFRDRKETLWGPTNRMIKRHDSIQADTLASVPIESLDFGPVFDWKGYKSKKPLVIQDEPAETAILEEVS